MTAADTVEHAPATLPDGPASDVPRASRVVDIAFALEAGAGEQLPRGHRRALAGALQRRLPWLASTPGAGVHRLNLSAGGGDSALLSRRTRLALRVPRERLDEAVAIEGVELVLEGVALRLRAPQLRELVPWGTLYAHVVAADDVGEEAFMLGVEEQLSTLGVGCRRICGRHQLLESGALQGYSLMLDGLSREGSLRILESGLGGHRLLGCGLFVPHRSAAAVGAPA